MSEARSLTPLSETDYEAIEAAVLETARGRWFMAEYAKRNRQADTMTLLNAIGRIERVVGLSTQQPANTPNLGEAAALIGDLRIDLERISGRAEERSSGLAVRIEHAAETIIIATESIQEVAWSLREAGADNAMCDMLDRRASEVSAAIALVDGTVQRIDKIADTIAMLDSSLRAFSDLTQEASSAENVSAATVARASDLRLPTASPLSNYDDIEIVEVGDHAAPVGVAPQPQPQPAKSASEKRVGTIQLLEDDIVFSDFGDEPLAAPEPMRAPRGTSETALRELDMLPVGKKLAYFA
ncbi:hypothetical protein [Bosea lathyri]|uniref:Uncharacterized protein n=1 Tax=Bosea lathyri TaxID=1036778 RepID=A0A1H5TVY2_9HYPH|nr:hypothetical protein [Bosea lathyri]SEF66929.1 hypothetical protein SAMN04488115_101792 [Bosea lathyri]